MITAAARGLGREDAGQLASEGRRAHLLTFVGPAGFFLGDDMGLTSTGRDFLAVFAQPHDDDPASVFAATRPSQRRA